MRYWKKIIIILFSSCLACFPRCDCIKWYHSSIDTIPTVRRSTRLANQQVRLESQDSRVELSCLCQDMNARLRACFEQSRSNLQVEAPIFVDQTEDTSTDADDDPVVDLVTLANVEDEADDGAKVEVADSPIDTSIVAPINESELLPIVNNKLVVQYDDPYFSDAKPHAKWRSSLLVCYFRAPPSTCIAVRHLNLDETHRSSSLTTSVSTTR